MAVILAYTVADLHTLSCCTLSVGWSVSLQHKIQLKMHATAAAVTQFCAPALVHMIF